jgi:hypothetical protein
MIASGEWANRVSEMAFRRKRHTIYRPIVPGIGMNNNFTAGVTQVKIQPGLQQRYKSLEWQSGFLLRQKETLCKSHR